MSWSPPPDASLLSPIGGHDGAWDHPDLDLYREMAALLQADEPLATDTTLTTWTGAVHRAHGGGRLTASDEDDDDDADEDDDGIGEEDIAILHQLLATQQTDQQQNAQSQQQQEQQPPSPKEPLQSTAVVVRTGKATKAKASARKEAAAAADTPESTTTTTAKRGRKRKASSSSSPSSTGGVLKIVNKTTRERQKEELIQLRALATELEQKLEQRRKQVTDGPPPGAKSSHARCAMLWAKIAKNQELEKRLAEKENEKLRGLVLGQLRLARSLEKVLRKRLRQQKTTRASEPLDADDDDEVEEV